MFKWLQGQQDNTWNKRNWVLAFATSSRRMVNEIYDKLVSVKYFTYEL